jgi:hypothetical protein
MAADSLKGDSANQAWGVMNVLAVTDFPDIRLKATILSADQGSILIIPREGGYLARIYVELDKLDRDERVEPQDHARFRDISSGRPRRGENAKPSLLTAEPRRQDLAKGFPIGVRFHSAPGIRLADAKPFHLDHTVKADGRWRLFLFADRDDSASAGSRLWRATQMRP